MPGRMSALILHITMETGRYRTGLSSHLKAPVPGPQGTPSGWETQATSDLPSCDGLSPLSLPSLACPSRTHVRGFGGGFRRPHNLDYKYGVVRGGEAAEGGNSPGPTGASRGHHAWPAAPSAQGWAPGPAHMPPPSVGRLGYPRPCKGPMSPTEGMAFGTSCTRDQDSLSPDHGSGHQHCRWQRARRDPWGQRSPESPGMWPVHRAAEPPRTPRPLAFGADVAPRPWRPRGGGRMADWHRQSEVPGAAAPSSARRCQAENTPKTRQSCQA